MRRRDGLACCTACSVEERDQIVIGSRCGHSRRMLIPSVKVATVQYSTANQILDVSFIDLLSQQKQFTITILTRFPEKKDIIQGIMILDY